MADMEIRDRTGAEDGAFGEVLAEVTALLERADLDYVVFGGIAAVVHGRPRSTEDIDLLVRPEDAKGVLGLLADAGFETAVKDERWIYKAWKRGVLVDVIFRVKREIYLDQEMVDRSRLAEYGGAKVRLLSPEDGIVVEALSHDDERPQHWYNALSVLSEAVELDWDYLRRRARLGPRRLLSLLVYAQSNDLPVPTHVIREMFDDLYGSDDDG